MSETTQQAPAQQSPGAEQQAPQQERRFAPYSEQRKSPHDLVREQQALEKQQQQAKTKIPQQQIQEKKPKEAADSQETQQVADEFPELPEKFKIDGKVWTKAEWKSQNGRGQAANKLLVEANKKFREASKILEQAEAKKRYYKENPTALYDEFGIDREEAARAYTQKWIAPDQEQELPPEQRAILNERRRAEAAEAELNKHLTEKQQQEIAHHAKLVEQEVTKEVLELMKSGNIPKSAGALQDVVLTMIRYHDKNIEITPAQALDLVNADKYEEQRLRTDKIADNDGAPGLRAFFGKRTWDKITQSVKQEMLEEYRAKMAQNAQPPKQQNGNHYTATQPQQKRARMSEAEFRKKFGM